MKIALVLPAFNEEASIEQSMLNVKSGIDCFAEHEFLLFPVDDASTDRTYEKILESTTRHGLSSIPFRNEANQGLVKTLMDSYGRVISTRGIDYVLKTDLDGDFDQSVVLKRMLPFVGQGADVVAGIRWREITPQMNAYEHSRRQDALRIMKEEFGISELDPPSAGSQLYSARAISELMVHPTIETYDKKWGLDFLIPLVARSIGYDVRIVRIENGKYFPERRPEEKVRTQYDTYVEIMGKLLAKPPESISRLYKK